MSDPPEWKGSRIDPYVVGERYQGIPSDEGRLYEAHHIETGAPALVVMPGEGETWSTNSLWNIRAQYDPTLGCHGAHL